MACESHISRVMFSFDEIHWASPGVKFPKFSLFCSHVAMGTPCVGTSPSSKVVR